MFYDTLKCTTCGRDKICVMISTFSSEDQMRVPRLEPHCTDCLHETHMDILESINNERRQLITRIK